MTEENDERKFDGTQKTDTTTSEVVKKCKGCGELVVGGRRERIEHKNICPAIDHSAAHVTPVAGQPRLAPLPVCPTCGKLFRNDAGLAEHQCAWKPSLTPEPGMSRRRSPFDEGLDILKPCETMATTGLGRTQRVQVENKLLKEYDNRMRRLLQRKHLADVDGRPTFAAGLASGTSSAASTMRSTRSSSSMCFAGDGAERTSCPQCGKGILSTMLREHITSSCLVSQIRHKLDALNRLTTADDEPAHASTKPSGRLSPRLRALDLPFAAAVQYEIGEILGAIALVVPLRSKFRDASGTIVLASVKDSMPQIRADVEAWAAERAEAARVAKPVTVWNPQQPVPSLRRVLHHTPFEIEAVRSNKVADATTLERCADLMLKDTAKVDRSQFDTSILALASAVRRGDMSLQDAAALRPGESRPLVSSSYENAINPALRH